jgi:16S rRNA (guanine1207-N2)-methyltransferase
MADKGKGFEHYFTAFPKSRTKFGMVQTCLCGRSFKFLTASGLFSKSRVDLGTRLLIENMVLPEKGNVLDLGCGYGAVGIAAAVFKPKLLVFMVDVNIRAVRLAKRNTEINGVRNVIVKRGSLYKPVKSVIFDCVLSNPPVTAGMETVKAIVCEGPSYLKKRGNLQMVVRSKIGGKRLCAMFEEAFGGVEVLARGSGYRVLLGRRA